MSDGVTYYTDDITLMPLRAIWQTSRRAPPVVAPLLFAYLCVRKILRWRFPPSYGAPRPETLPIVDSDAIPREAHTAVAPFIRSCEDAGFHVVFYMVPNYIGAKQGASVTLLDSNGTSSATAVWLSMSIGDFSKTQVVFSCHSSLAHGAELHTSAAPTDHWRPELIPPNKDLKVLSPDAPVSEVIAEHLDRINEQAPEVVRFTDQSLTDHALDSTQKLYDHLIENGHYVPLTPAEVERLRG